MNDYSISPRATSRKIRCDESATAAYAMVAELSKAIPPLLRAV